jgi:hypothetical protein
MAIARQLWSWSRLIWLLVVLGAGPAGCKSPEEGRPRGGGAGADGGNYHARPIHAPSKLDGTKDVPEPFRI